MPWARPLLGHRVWVGDGAVPGMAAPCQAAWVLCGCSAPSRQLPSINLEPPNWSLPGLGASSWQHGAGALPSQGVRAWRRAGAGLALCALPSVLLSSLGRVPVHQHTARGSNRVPAFLLLLLLLLGTQSFGPRVPGALRVWCRFSAPPPKSSPPRACAPRAAPPQGAAVLGRELVPQAEAWLEAKVKLFSIV